MDEEITELVEELDNALTFVQDVELLRNKLERFTELIEQVLQVIKECSKSINKYLDSNKPGADRASKWGTTAHSNFRPDLDRLY